MRITESQLRKIIRQEVRRLSETAPGVMAPRPADMDPHDLMDELSKIHIRISRFLEDRGVVAASDVSHVGSVAERLPLLPTVQNMGKKLVGKTVSGLEGLTDGSPTATIAGFGIDGVEGYITVDLQTMHGIMTVNSHDIFDVVNW